MPSNGQNGREEVSQHLQEALAQLRLNLMRVELWAAAMEGFRQPVPNYEPSDDMLLPPQRHTDQRKSQQKSK
jgi:hypothetical protein